MLFHHQANAEAMLSLRGEEYGDEIPPDLERELIAEGIAHVFEWNGNRHGTTLLLPVDAEAAARASIAKSASRALGVDLIGTETEVSSLAEVHRVRPSTTGSRFLAVLWLTDFPYPDEVKISKVLKARDALAEQRKKYFEALNRRRRNAEESRR